MDRESAIGPCSPFFIVSSITDSLHHYVEHLGFECRFLSPGADPAFAIVGRNSAQIMLKVIGEAVKPLPNRARHEWARWDAFVYVENPDQLANEFAKHSTFSQILVQDTDDGLLGFELADPDGYVCFFGCPG